MTMPIVIAENNTLLDIFLGRLGRNVPGSSTVTLTDDATYTECTEDTDLETAVSSGDITINDGTSDLTVAEALVYLNSSGNFNGPPAVGLVTDTLVRLGDNTGRYAEKTGVTVDSSDNIATTGTVDVSGVLISGTAMAINDLSDVNTTTLAPTSQDRLRWDGSEWVVIKYDGGNVDPTVNDDSTAGFTVWSRWLNILEGTEWVCVEATAGAAVWEKTTDIPTDLPTVQVRHSGTLAITTSWADIDFDTTDVENDTSVLEHDNTNTDRINIGETGLYMITFMVSANADAGEETMDFRVRVNDTTVIPGSERQISEDDEISAAGNVFVVSLTSGDFISYQVLASGTGNTLIPESTYTVTRLQGAKGDPGSTGSGSNVTVQDDGVDIPNTPHSTLNFSTGLTAVDSGGGVATITGFSPNIAQYRQTGNLTINTSATTVVLNANDFEDSNYTRSGENITIDVAGIYRIAYNVYFDTGATARRTVDAWVENNTVEVVPSRSSSYARNWVDDTNSSGATFLVQLAATDVVRLRCQSTGTSGTAIGQGNRMWILLELVRTV